MQLIKFLALSSLASRRACEQLIKSGKIYCNNHCVEDPTYVVKDTDVITHKGKIIRPKDFTYVLLHKPLGYITSKKDCEGRRLITDLLPENLKKILDPVGRLDYNTTGALLLTNDGQLAYTLTHPKYTVRKTYVATASKKFTPDIAEALRQGAHLPTGFVKPDKVFWNAEYPQQIAITIHSGENRIIRRLLEFFGFFVKKLHRKDFAGISIKNLSSGAWRRLTKKEILSLKNTES